MVEASFALLPRAVAGVMEVVAGAERGGSAGDCMSEVCVRVPPRSDQSTPDTVLGEVRSKGSSMVATMTVVLGSFVTAAVSATVLGRASAAARWNRAAETRRMSCGCIRGVIGIVRAVCLGGAASMACSMGHLLPLSKSFFNAAIN